MSVTWIKKVEEKGFATLTNSYVVINQMFKDKFSSAYIAVLGVDEINNLIIKPINLDESESPLYKNSVLLKISVFNTFVRLGNTSNMKIISDIIKADLSNNIKYETYWNEAENALVIETGGGQ